MLMANQLTEGHARVLARHQKIRPPSYLWPGGWHSGRGSASAPWRLLSKKPQPKPGPAPTPQAPELAAFEEAPPGSPGRARRHQRQ
ncbi:MAG: hypothetical protein ACOX6Y_09015 [Christensenellales bacterium]